MTTSSRAVAWRVIALAAGSVLCFALQQHLIDVAGLMQQGRDVHGNGGRLLGPEFYQTLPYPVVDEAFGAPSSVHLALLALGAVETLILYGLYRALRGRESTLLERGCVVIAAAVMLALGLGAHTVIGFDLYAYLGYAKLASVHAAYAPPPARFTGELSVINDAWGAPLVASYYGPLWVALSHAVAGGAAGLRDGILALRLVEIPPFMAIAGALAVRRTGLGVVALFALNPAIHMLFIANAHNDLMAVALVLVALCVAKRSPLSAVVLIAGAALIKLPFVACAAFAFPGPGHTVRRMAYVALAVALCVGVSWRFAGIEYLHDLLFRLHQVNETASALNALTGKALRVALLLVAAGALAGAFFRGIMWRSASWSFLAMSTVVWPWYLSWSFPYAALERRALAQYLMFFPLAAAALENAFPHLGLGQVAMLVMFVVAVKEIVRGKTVAIGAPEMPVP